MCVCLCVRGCVCMRACLEGAGWVCGNGFNTAGQCGRGWGRGLWLGVFGCEMTYLYALLNTELSIYCLN
jgi:hypothetical protein